jgi:hypothetical protein
VPGPNRGRPKADRRRVQAPDRDRTGGLTPARGPGASRRARRARQDGAGHSGPVWPAAPLGRRRRQARLGRNFKAWYSESSVQLELGCHLPVTARARALRLVIRVTTNGQRILLLNKQQNNMSLHLPPHQEFRLPGRLDSDILSKLREVRRCLKI